MAEQHVEENKVNTKNGPTLKQRAANNLTKVKNGAKKHWKGILGGAAGIAAVGAAAVLAARKASEGAIEVPLDLGDIGDAIADAVPFEE